MLATGFTIVTGGNPAMAHVLTLSNPVATPGLNTNWAYSFTLQATPAQKTALATYFGTMGGNIAYQTQINNEINGTEPFFYLSPSDGLVDGFKYALGLASPTPPAYPLTINDNYPKDTYTYSGTLIGSNNAVLPVTIKLIVN